jgi:hypothetical protein
MKQRVDLESFFKEEWHWFAAGAGVLMFAAAAALAFLLLGVDPGQAADDALGATGSRDAKDTGVVEINMDRYVSARKATASPSLVAEPSDAHASFLASGRRVYCESGEAPGGRKACALPIPFGAKVCPHCGVKQPEEMKVVLDADKDGLPDEYEKKYGLDPKNAADANEDKDGDGFTNAEEYEAGTDPTDPDSHRDYLDFLEIVPPLENTLLPFVFDRMTPTPSGMKFFFRDPKKRNVYGQRGTTYPVLMGAEVGKTGFFVKSFEEKKKKVAIPGSNVTKDKDVSTVTVERASDGKRITLRVENPRFEAVDKKAKLRYSRGGERMFTVAPGDEFKLDRNTYKVVGIERNGKKAHVSVEDVRTGAKRNMETLEH